MKRNFILAIVIALLVAASAYAETGEEAWLRYAPVANARTAYRSLPQQIVAPGSSTVVQNAAHELARGLASMLGMRVSLQTQRPDTDAFVIGTTQDIRSLFPAMEQKNPSVPESFALSLHRTGGHTYWIISGNDEHGVLYGTFRLLQMIARGESLSALDIAESPAAPVRWVNQWDNPDGSIERGYAGRSIFFNAGSVRSDLTRAGQYARLLASIGINGCTVNNVNADPGLLSSENLRQIARIADVFRPWGVRLSLSIDLSSPKAMGGLETFDPLDPAVAEWWRRKFEEVYSLIPDFGGAVIKADSEGRPGPSQYGRTPAEAANIIARALKPHGGLVLYRGFVYNHHLDWKDLKADRARAGYDNFRALDGKFDDNVIIQIKHGPIDFQVREPVSPLFAALRQTNQAVELQVTQEYTGQQRHLVFLAPMWKQVLDFDLRVNDQSTPVKDIVEGKSFHRPTGGFVAVVNVGLDTNWLHHPLAMANLYAFGRLSWNPNTPSEEIAADWTRLTFGGNERVLQTVDGMLLSSWRIYEEYTGPLGLGTLTDIIHVHFGPGIESAERNGWGQWIRADREGVGMDRTVATGTGYIGQYPPEVARVYESLQLCPDELLLFMHHVPYTYRLHSGKTVIQHIYDSHYDGAAGAAALAEQWRSLHGLLDDERYRQVLALQEYQAGHAVVWRDAICDWFFKMSGIPDEKGRVGHHPYRIEAEHMTLDGYEPVDVTPWETASGGKAVICPHPQGCAAETVFHGAAGNYRIVVQYFDLPEGRSNYGVFLNRAVIDRWAADNVIPTPSNRLDGHTSTRHVLAPVRLKNGDVLRIQGVPSGPEPAPLDYIEIRPIATPASQP